MAENSLTLVLPEYAALLAQDLNRSAIPPTLQKLLNKARFSAAQTGLSRLLFELFAADIVDHSDLPMAAIRQPSRTTLCADPCYLHPDRDQLLLFHEGLRLNQQEAWQLVEAIQPLFAEFSAKLKIMQPDQWLLELESLPDIEFTALSDIEGQPVTGYLPVGRQASDWIRLWNEIQMVLFDLPLNEQRAAAGKMPVNSLWFWGSAPIPQWRQWDRVVGQNPLLSQLAQASGSSISTNEGELLVCNDGKRNTLFLAQALVWQGDWQQQLARAEEKIFKPLWQCLRRRKFSHVRLVVPNWGQYELQAPSWWRLWR